MFTGLIEEVGEVVTIDSPDGRTQLGVAAPRIANNLQIGEASRSMVVV